MFGKEPYAHRLLRWLSVPPFRVGMLLVAVPILIRGHSTWVSAAGVALLALSVIARTTNLVVMRRRAAVHRSSSRAR